MIPHFKNMSSCRKGRFFLLTSAWLLLGTLIMQLLGNPYWSATAFTILTFGSLYLTCKFTTRMRDNIVKVTELCDSIQAGNLEFRIFPPLEPEGIISQLRTTVNKIADNIDGFIREAHYSSQAAVENKFYRVVLEHGMSGSFKNLAVLLNQSMSKAEQKNDIIVELIKTAEERLSSISASTEESSCTMREISTQLANTVAVTNEAQEKSADLTENINDLLENIGKTSAVLDMIQKITEQTNLLALNAAIEAARAGDAGRGFSVVADEVSKLADETTKSTQSVTELMAAIQQGIHATQETTSKMAESIVVANQNTVTISAAIEEQNIATEDISKSSSAILDELKAIEVSTQ